MNCAGETGDSQLSPYYHHPLEYSFRRAFLNFNLAWKNNTGRISLTINEVLHLALMQYQYKSTKNKKKPHWKTNIFNVAKRNKHTDKTVIATETFDLLTE